MSGIFQLLLGRVVSAIKAGALYMWGDNPNGQLGNNAISGTSTATPTQALPTTSSLYATTISSSTGTNTGLLVKSNGTLWVWGQNASGELGLGDTANRSSPIQVGALTTWAKVAGGQGANSSFGILSTGALYGWGSNPNGELGINTVIDVSSPVQVGTGTDWALVSIASKFTAAIKTNGTLWTWASNEDGALGTNESVLVNRSSPVQVGALTNWRQVSVGPGFMVATKTDNTLWAWGRNDTGVLGQNNLTYRSSPVQVGALTNWLSVSAGSLYWVAVKTDGTLWSCGENGNGQLGQNNLTLKSSPVQIGALTNWSLVKAGYYGWIAVKNDWTAWGCGYNVFGQLGNRTGTDKSSPVQIGRSRKWMLPSASADQSMLISRGGEIFTFGRAQNGALGNLTAGLNHRSSPVQIGNAGYYSISQAGADGQNFVSVINNQLWVCGNNQGGQLGQGNTVARSSPVQVGSLVDWVGNGSTGEFTIHVIKVNQTLWGIGYNALGNLGDNSTVDKSSPVQIGSATDWVQISTGTDTSGAIKAAGELWMWGQNTYGELGQGDSGAATRRSSPTQVGALTDWYQVSVAFAVLAVKTDGTLWAWGYNNNGGLGLNDRSDKSSPNQVGALTTWVHCAAGAASYAVKSDGTLWAWGSNAYGQLGQSDVIDRSSPVQVGADTDWTSVWVISNDAVIAQKSTGAVYAWGRGSGSFQNANASGTSLSSPVQIGSATNWGDIRGEKNGGILITTTGASYRYGSNSWGQFGTGSTTIGRYSSPIQIGSDATWTRLSLGDNYALAIKSGALYGWGINDSGGLGDGTVISRSSPVQIGALTTWSFVSAGYNNRSSFAIKTDGTLWAWGGNDVGQLGLIDVALRSSPVQVGALTNWSKAFGGSSGSVALKTNGTIWFVGGLNEYGQNGQNEATTVYRSSPVQIGALTTWAQLSRGNYHSLAVKTDGTLWAWGYNAHGQLGQNDRANRSSPVQIGALTTWQYVGCENDGSFAIKTDGTLWAWGYNLSGSLGDGTVINRSSPVQIGLLTNWGTIISGNNNQHTIALKTDGTVWSWGVNNAGQLGVNDTAFRSSPTQIGSDTTWKAVSAGYADTGFQGGIK